MCKVCYRTEGLCLCWNPSPVIAKSRLDQQEQDCKFTCKLLCCKCSFCYRVATKEWRNSQLLSQLHRNKICERCFLCRSLELCKSSFVTNVPTVTRLQYVQNALARFVTGASKYTHITSTLRTLHWLPVRQRIIFKTLVLVYKYLTTGQPKYFAPYLPLYKSAVNTRRSNPKNLFLLVPSYCPSIHKSKVHFNNSFSYDAPKLWNDLPYDIRSAPNLSSFKSRLKTYLFQKSFPP